MLLYFRKYFNEWPTLNRQLKGLQRVGLVEPFLIEKSQELEEYNSKEELLQQIIKDISSPGVTLRDRVRSYLVAKANMDVLMKPKKRVYQEFATMLRVAKYFGFVDKHVKSHKEFLKMIKD
jgi:hypothetical protein